VCELFVQSDVIKMFSQIQNYCKETTLHGFKYITSENCSRSEKVFWLISIIASFLGAVLLVNKLHTEISKTLIVTMTSNTPVPIEEIPFPAVTFCQEMRIQENENAYLLMELFKRKLYDMIITKGFVGFQC
jgi:Amiloride-sensitive sodium channel